MRTLITKILKRLNTGVLSPGRPKASQWLLWAVIMVPWPWAAWGDVRLVLSDTGPHYRQIAEDINLYLENFHPDVARSQTLSTENLELVNSDDLIIAIGTKAAEKSAENYPENPMLYLFITHQTWDTLSGSMGKRAAIVIDQPAARYLKLARLVAPYARTLGTVYGPISGAHQHQLQAAASTLGFELALDNISRDSNPLEVISPIFDVSDVFVALPDEALINRNLAQWALHLGFKKQIPIIGFSQSYTKAGALASIFTSPENMSRQSLEWLNKYLSASSTPDWRELQPQYFTITLNKRVMNALGLNLDAKTLMTEMSRPDTAIRHHE